MTPPTTNVDDTVSTVAAPQREEVRSSERPEWELRKEKVLARQKEIEALEAQKQEEERKARERLREKYLNALRNAFEKEADVDVDAVVSPSDRERAGIASMYVMELAAEADKRVKRVTLYMDGKGTIRDLIGFLKFLGAKNKRGELNPNVSFLLPNGTGFLSGDENIEGVELTAESAAMRITFPKTTPSAADKKKPDTKKASAGSTSTTGTTSGATGATASTTGGATATSTDGGTAIEMPDWMMAMEIEEDKEGEKRRKERAERVRKAKRTYKGSFKPDTGGVLFDDALASDVQKGYMTADELIDEVLKYNAEQAKKNKKDQRPIVLVPLMSNRISADTVPFVALTAEQMKKARGVIFSTDEEGAKEAEKDTKNFTVKKITLDGTTLVFVFVLQDDGTMTDVQKKALEAIEKKESLEKLEQEEKNRKRFADREREIGSLEGLNAERNGILKDLTENNGISPLVRGRRNSFDARIPNTFGFGSRTLRMYSPLNSPHPSDTYLPLIDPSADETGTSKKFVEFLRNATDDIILNKEQSKVFLEYAQDLLNANFFTGHAGHTVTLDVSDGDTSDLEKILNVRGLDYENKDGTLSFTVAFALPDFDCGRLPTIWLNENTEESGFDPLKNVHFMHRLKPEACPKAVQEALPNFDEGRDLILDAVCYADENSLQKSHTIALEFGDWVPQEVTQWTSKALCMQNITVTKNDGTAVERNDEGIGAFLQFNIDDESLEAANAWFVCEYEVGEEDQKEKHRIAVHLFFAEEQPASIVFEELEYPLAINDKADAEKQKVANDRAGTLRNLFIEALASELNAIPEPKTNKNKTFSPERNSLWASYLRDGLISASELTGAVDSYNSNRGDRAPIEEIDLFSANLYDEGKDVVYFSKENIRDLYGTSVWIYDTERKEEFTGLNYQEIKYNTVEGENRREHVALYVFDEQIEEGDEQNEEEEGEEEGGEEEQADDNKEGNQNEMQIEERIIEENETQREEKQQHEIREIKQGEIKEEEERKYDEEEANINEGNNINEEEGIRIEQNKIIEGFEQNEIRTIEENIIDITENKEINTEKKEPEPEPEQKTPEKQLEKKLTLELLGEPDDETKKLFAEMDLKAFLDKARTDLTEAGKDPRDAYIDLDAIVYHHIGGIDERARSKITLDVLLQYPLWQYHIGELLSEEDGNELGELDGKVLEFNREEKWFYAFPRLSETNGTLTIKDNADVKYWVEKQEGGLKMLAFAVKYAPQKGEDISVIDFSGITLKKDAECDFKYFAGLPVSLRGEWLETKSEEITARPWVRKLSDDTVLVRREDGTFGVRYEPKHFYEVFGISDVFMENLRKALIQYANFPVGSDAPEKVVQSLTGEDFKCIPVWFSNDGKLKTADDARFGCNKEHLFDLVHGVADEDSMKSWSEFSKKLKDFDPKYYKSIILFFLHWDGSNRVDFSTFNLGVDWKDRQNITYGCVLKNLKVQETWNSCLNEVTEIPNDGEIKAMFGKLDTLFKSDEYMSDLDITKPWNIKQFLKSIKDWDDWDGDEELYVTDEENNDGNAACFELDDWENYQKWRFEQYFLRGKKLSTSRTNPIKACEQGYADWKRICQWKEDL